MEAVLNIDTNPQNIFKIKYEQMTARLKNINKKIEKYQDLAEKLLAVGATMGILGKLGIPLGLALESGAVINTAALTLFAGGLTAFAGIAVSAPASILTLKADLLNDRIKANQIQEKQVENYQIIADPLPHLKKVIEKEHKKLKVFEDINGGRGIPSVDVLRDAGLDASMAIGVLTEKASKELSSQRQIVSILEIAQYFAEKCNDKSTIYEMLKLAENPTEDNIINIQKIMSGEQKTAEMSTKGKDEKKSYGRYSKSYEGYEI